MSTLGADFSWCSREGESPPHPLKTLAKTAEKTNLPAVIPLVEVRLPWRSHLKFYALRAIDRLEPWPRDGLFIDRDSVPKQPELPRFFPMSDGCATKPYSGG